MSAPQSIQAIGTTYDPSIQRMYSEFHESRDYPSVEFFVGFVKQITQVYL